MDAAQAQGWRLNTPDGDHERGASVVIDVPEGAAVTKAMISRDVIVDHRPGAGIRIAPHFYNSEEEIDHAVDVLTELVGAS